MHIGKYHVGKTHTGKGNYGKPHGFKTLIKPSKKSQKKQHKAIQNNVRRNRTIDGDWSYWGARLGRYPTLSNRKAMLLRKQKGRCSICKLQFTLGDDMDTDHIIPLYLGGKDIWANVQLLHAHCHVSKTGKDSLLHVMIDGRGAVEGKLSRTVLKTSRRVASTAEFNPA